MAMQKFTTQEQNVLRAYMNARNLENWGMWPPAENWPIPDRFGAYTCLQYETPGGLATVVKFDHAVALADNRAAQRIAVGSLRRLEIDIVRLTETS